MTHDYRMIQCHKYTIFDNFPKNNLNFIGGMYAEKLSTQDK